MKSVQGRKPTPYQHPNVDEFERMVDTVLFTSEKSQKVSLDMSDPNRKGLLLRSAQPRVLVPAKSSKRQ